MAPPNGHRSRDTRTVLDHRVLVEGIVSDVPPICGGIVLEPVRLSAMPELDANCNSILPADDRWVNRISPAEIADATSR
jgi:hypothetical protein